MSKQTKTLWANELMSRLDPTADDFVLVDLQQTPLQSLTAGNQPLKPIVLLNATNAKQMATLFGFGAVGDCLIIKPFATPNVYDVTLLGVPYEVGASTDSQTHESDEGGTDPCHQTPAKRHKQGCSKKQDHSDPFSDETNFSQLSICEQARMIRQLVSEVPIARDTPPGLPLDQYNLIYLTVERQWSLSDQQVTVNSVIFEVSLFASYNPTYKYLRIRTIGAGFNPSAGSGMQSDSTYDRGYFQSAVNIHMHPATHNLSVLSTDPKNVNGQTSYTAGSEFTVGVDISKNPSFSPSYSISESKTTVISDFNVYNNSAGSVADWEFKLSLLDNHDIWNMFSHPFMKKGQVKELPALATRNLQPLTEAVWFSPNTFTGVVGLSLNWRVDHYRCWVTGNWSNFTDHYHHKWVTVGYVSDFFYVDFGAVHA